MIRCHWLTQVTLSQSHGHVVAVAVIWFSGQTQILSKKLNYIMWVSDCTSSRWGKSQYKTHHGINSVALMGRNTTGPPYSVGRPTAHAPGRWHADRPRTRMASRLSSITDDDKQQRQQMPAKNNTGQLGGLVIIDASLSSVSIWSFIHDC